MYFIYSLKSPSAKFYIGQTSQASIEIRFTQHKQSYARWVKDNRPRKSYDTKLFYAFDKYPPEQWIVEELAQTEDKDRCNFLEIEYIKLYDAVENGYNIMNGGHGWGGIELNESHKNKISKARKEFFKTEEGIAWKEQLSNLAKVRFSGENHPSYGKPAWNSGKKCPSISEGRMNGKKYEYTETDLKKMSTRATEMWKEGGYLATRTDNSDYHTIYYDNGTIHEFRSVNEYSRVVGIPLPTLRNCINESKGSPLWGIIRIDKIDYKKTKGGNQGRPQSDYQKQRAKEANSHKHIAYYIDGSTEEFRSMKDFANMKNIPYSSLNNILYGKCSGTRYGILKIERG